MFNVGDKVLVDAQSIALRYALVPNLLESIRADNYNRHATITHVRRTMRRVLMDEGATEFVVAFDVAPTLGNLVFDADELELVAPVQVRKLDEAIAAAEQCVEDLKKYRAMIMSGF